MARILIADLMFAIIVFQIVLYVIVRVVNGGANPEHLFRKCMGVTIWIFVSLILIGLFKAMAVPIIILLVLVARLRYENSR